MIKMIIFYLLLTPAIGATSIIEPDASGEPQKISFFRNGC